MTSPRPALGRRDVAGDERAGALGNIQWCRHSGSSVAETVVGAWRCPFRHRRALYTGVIATTNRASGVSPLRS
jgi:hypothetical protein